MTGPHGRRLSHLGLAAFAAGALVMPGKIRATTPGDTPVLAKSEADTPFAAKIAALQSARDTGLVWIAEDLAAEILADPRLPQPARDSAGLLLADARLQRGALKEAVEALGPIPPPNAAKSLRLGLITLAAGRPDDAAKHLAGCTEAPLDSDDKYWREVLGALLTCEQGDINKGAARLTELKTRARHPNVSAQVGILRLRAILAAKSPSLDPISEISTLVEILPDARQTYQLGKTQALALNKAGRKAEALLRLQSLPANDPDLRAERFLLCGVVAGGRSPEGRKFLFEAIDSAGHKEIQALALDVLTDAVAATPREELILQANPVYDELTARADAPDTPAKPRATAAIADRIHFARARLMLLAASAASPESAPAARAKAAAALEKVLDRPTPDSPVYADALLLSAEIARESRAYRKAAVAYEKLAALAPSPDAPGLRLLAADCYRENGDHANAAAAYAEARKSLESPQKRGAALIGEIHSLLKSGRTDAATSALTTSSDSDRESVLRATWLVADARRVEGARVAAMSLVNGVLGAAPAPDQTTRLRFLWLRALLELDDTRAASAVATAREITAIASGRDLPREIRENAAAILAQTTLLRARAALIAGDAGAAESGFKTLRETYPDSVSAAASHVVEGRHLAAAGRHADALETFREGYERHRKSADPRVLEAAHDALFAAAVEALALADRRADRPGQSHLDDAFNLLDKLTKDLDGYPDKTYAATRFHRARLMQGDILRRLNNFDSAEKLYEDLSRKLPDHPDRLRADIARADCILQKSDLRPEIYPVAAAEYERLLNIPGRPDDLAAEASCKRAIALSKSPVKGSGDAASDARLARREAAKLLWLRTDELLRNAAKLGPTGRHWLSRAILLLADLELADHRPTDAARALRLIPDINAAIPDESRRLPGEEVARRRIQALSATTQPASGKP